MNELIQRAVESSQNGITIAQLTNGQFPLIYANGAFYRLSGYAPSEVIGRDCRFLQGGLTDQPGLQTLRAALAQGLEATVLLRNFRKDGSEFWNELMVSPVHGDNGELTHYIGIQYDVTQREHQGQAIQALNQALAQRSEALVLANESLRSFSSSASHDLRAPLSSIRGFCAALKKSADLSAGSRPAHYVSRIEANVERMGLLIEALLKLAQSGSGTLTLSECKLSPMAREVVDALQADASGPQAQVHIEPGLEAVGDPALLRSVLQNLLGNALKYSSKTPGARVDFGRELDAAGQARFFVRDNGEGFDMQTAGKLFGAFERFHSEADYPGTGLGLATVRRIVTRHGGVVFAESAPGAGAVFYFTLGTPRTD